LNLFFLIPDHCPERFTISRQQTIAFVRWRYYSRRSFEITDRFWLTNKSGLVALRKNVGLMIERSWVRLPVRSLSNGYYLRKNESSSYITNTKVNSVFHSFVVGKLSTGLSGWG